MDQSLTLTSQKQQKGAFFEALSLKYLKAQGLTLLHQNWLMPKIGEIDLIMLETGKHWNTLVFVEVRVRSDNRFGTAIDSINRAKQKKIIKTAQYYLVQHPEYEAYDCRFDIVCYDICHDTDSNDLNLLDTSQPLWIKSAFLADY